MCLHCKWISLWPQLLCFDGLFGPFRHLMLDVVQSQRSLREASWLQHAQPRTGRAFPATLIVFITPHSACQSHGCCNDTKLPVIFILQTSTVLQACLIGNPLSLPLFFGRAMVNISVKTDQASCVPHTSNLIRFMRVKRAGASCVCHCQ